MAKPTLQSNTSAFEWMIPLHVPTVNEENWVIEWLSNFITHHSSFITHHSRSTEVITMSHESNLFLQKKKTWSSMKLSSCGVGPCISPVFTGRKRRNWRIFEFRDFCLRCSFAHCGVLAPWKLNRSLCCSCSYSLPAALGRPRWSTCVKGQKMKRRGDSWS